MTTGGEGGVEMTCPELLNEVELVEGAVFV